MRTSSRLLHSLVFSAGLLATLRLAAAVADRFDPLESRAYGLQDRQRVADLLRDSSQVQTLVLGNSHAGSIDAVTLGKGSIVLNRGGGDLFEVSLYARSLLQRLPHLRLLIITISPFSLDWDNAADNAMAIRRIHAYTALPTWHYLPSDAFRLMVGKLDPYAGLTSVVRSDAWQGVFHAIAGRRSQSPTTTAAGPVNAGCGQRTSKQLDEHADHRAQDAITTMESMARVRSDIHGRALKALTDITLLAKERHVDIVLITPPYWHSYSTRLAAKIPDIAGPVREFADQRLIPYLDHRSDPDFAEDPTAFYDSDHLDHCGAARFTQEVMGQLFSRPTPQDPPHAQP